MSKRKEMTPEYIKSKVEVSHQGCWLWMGTSQSHGYANFQLKVCREEYGTQLGHRISYMLFNGVKLTPEQTIDHLCRVRQCVNPEHLEVVPIQENNRRRDEKYREDNPYFKCGHLRTETGRWRRSGYQANTGKPKRAFYCHTCLLELNRRRKYATSNSLR